LFIRIGLNSFQAQSTTAQASSCVPARAECGQCAIKALRQCESPENAVYRPKCGVQHSDPAVVGRKSGSLEMPNADTCTIAGADPLPEADCGKAGFAFA